MSRRNVYLVIIISFIIISVIFILKYKNDAPAQGNENLKIIFESSRNVPAGVQYPQRYIELYTMNPDGSDVKRITDNLYWEHKPQVSPEEDKILVTIHYSPENVKETDPGWEIAIMGFNGSIVRRLTDNNYFDGNARWNKDGTKIVFVSDSNKRTSEDINKGLVPKYDIYIMNADGSGKRQLTFSEDGDVNADPSFSSDGHIYYIHSENYSSNFDLWVMSEDGRGKHMVFSHNAQINAVNDPAVSPDGNTIIFEGRITNSTSQSMYNLFMISQSGNGLMQITQNDGESDIWPSYSSDGRRITYFTYEWNPNGRHTNKIRVAENDGSEERKISSFPWESFPSWFEEQ